LFSNEHSFNSFISQFYFQIIKDEFNPITQLEATSSQMTVHRAPVFLPNTNSLRLPTTENVRAVVNEINTKVEKIEVTTLSSDEDNQTTVSNPQPLHSSFHRLSTTPTASLTMTINQPTAQKLLKRFKCAKCWHRSNWCSNILHHLKVKHGNMFANKKFVQTLDKVDAARTLAAFNLKYLNQHLHNRHRRQIYKSKIFVCKCGMCEYRAAQKSNASSHMPQVHKVDSNAARRLVKVLSLDEAKSTVGECNKKLANKVRFYYNSEIDDDHAEDIFQIDQNTKQDNTGSVSSDYEDVSNVNEVNLSSEEEEDSQTEPEVENQQSNFRQRQPKTQLQRSQMAVSNKNKKFKCVKCHFRANWWWCFSKHFKTYHREVMFNNTECIQVLDEDEATRTLEAYEQNRASNRIVCKKYKCGKCEYRTGKLSHAYHHVRQVHKVEFHEAKRLVKVLQLNEARKTMGDYNKFAGQRSKSCSKLRIKRDRETESAASNGGATTSQIQPGQMAVCNKKFKCVKCDFRSNRPRYVSVHFKNAHSEVALSSFKCVEQLDEDEATRTLEAYERNHVSNSISCKQYKCGKCEFRTGRKPHAYRHMSQVHKVEFNEAKMLIKVLPLDEAATTVDDYNKKFACASGLAHPNFWLKELGKTGSAASSIGVTTSIVKPTKTACNKKFKCVRCEFRSNWSRYVNKHFNNAHPQETNSCLQRVEVLDDVEATRTLEAYERNYARLCKPFKCGICEYRTRISSNAYSHMSQVHKVEFHQAKRLVKVLPLDEAEKTVDDFNKKFVRKGGRFCSKLPLENEGKTVSRATGNALTSKDKILH
jgi:hydrogenase maturation factor